jgi:hypothetical protein
MPTQKCALGFVENLARHVHPRAGEKIFCMLEAYMDESGIHDGAHACVIAGYWGHEKRWRHFENEWKKILHDADEPTLTEFHSVDFWKPNGARKGVFKNWSDDKADAFIAALLDCIGSHQIYPATSTLVVSAWNKLSKNEKMFLTGGRFDGKRNVWITPSAPNQTYYLPFQFVVVAAALACKESFKVHCVFDLHKQFKNHASTLFALLKKDPTLSCRERLGEFSMADSKDAPGLQAADLLAYQSYLHAKERAFKNTPTKMSALPWIFRRAMKNCRDERNHLFFDDIGLKNSFRNIPEYVRHGNREFPIEIHKLA